MITIRTIFKYIKNYFADIFPVSLFKSGVALPKISSNLLEVLTSLQSLIFPFSTAILTDIALRKSRILFPIQWGVLQPPEALPIHTLSKLHYLIHEL